LIVKLFGYEIRRTKSIPQPTLPVSTWGSGGWFNVIRESFTGAWQRNVEIRTEFVLTYHAVYACVTLIASDISKLRIRLMQQDNDGIWNEIEAAAFSPVLRKPNRYQNRIKFYEQWMVSKLIHGNTYVLKQRDGSNIVRGLYILDPLRTRPAVADDGSVWYDLGRDPLSNVPEDRIRVPASEIIHDVMVPLYHPLCGVSPITACGLAAVQGLLIQGNTTKLFQNGAKPGGLLLAPGNISDKTAKDLKDYWDQNFTGQNAGKIAVLGDGLKFESLSINAVDSQLIEQVKWTAEVVCSCFHVPPYMIGVGPMPNYNNIQALNQQYYAQALQNPIECIELCLDEGLGLAPEKVEGKTYGTEFDLDDLLRMDSKTLAETEKNLAGIKAPNESRKRLNLKPVTGGDSPMTQQQNFSLEALAKRDAKDDPFASKAPAPSAATPAADDGADDDAPIKDGWPGQGLPLLPDGTPFCSGPDAVAQGDSKDFADEILTWSKHHERRAAA
jgi:HK97 family phage portal protein